MIQNLCKVIIDNQQGRKVAEILYNSFNTTGIFGKSKKDLPENIIPKGIEKGSVEHILFLTLTVSIDYMRDADQLWCSARKTYEDPNTNYLFVPREVYKIKDSSMNKIKEDMKKHNLSKRSEKDAEIWVRLSTTFYEKWKGDPYNLFKNFNWDAERIIEELTEFKYDYPYLRGLKIAPLWLRMLRDIAGLENLKNLEKIPIPVDVHIARASNFLGVIKNDDDSILKDDKLPKCYGNIRDAWSKSVEGLNINGKKIIALDMDEPLWLLSRYGCSKIDEENSKKLCSECVVKDLCRKVKNY